MRVVRADATSTRKFTLDDIWVTKSAMTVTTAK